MGVPVGVGPSRRLSAPRARTPTNWSPAGSARASVPSYWTRRDRPHDTTPGR